MFHIDMVVGHMESCKALGVRCELTGISISPPEISRLFVPCDWSECSVFYLMPSSQGAFSRFQLAHVDAVTTCDNN
jgi:hypothetical protein